MRYPKVLFSLGKSRGRRLRGGMCTRETERKSVLRSAFPSASLSSSPLIYFSNCFKTAGLLITRSPVHLNPKRPLAFPHPELSSLAAQGETGQCEKHFAATFIPNTRNEPLSFPESLGPSEFVCAHAERTWLYRSLPPPPSLFKTKTLCVAFVTLIPILPTPGAQADELPRNTKF